MGKIEFKFNLEKDARNWWAAANIKSNNYDWTKILPPFIFKEIKEKSWEDAKPFLISFLGRQFSKNKEKFDLSINQIREKWGDIEEKYFTTLEKLTSKKLEVEKPTVFMTTLSRCPYDLKENYFMVNIFSSPSRACLTIAHELIHFHFHEHYWGKCEKYLGNEKTADLKEALTVLLNLEFKDLGFTEDKGYPKHQELRKELANFWLREKDFDKLIDFGINFLKTP